MVLLQAIMNKKHIRFYICFGILCLGEILQEEQESWYQKSFS